MEQDLQRALEKGQMSVYYQPLINCSTGALTGFEALLRWQHPDRDFIPPSEFIPIAEESGLMYSSASSCLSPPATLPPLARTVANSCERVAGSTPKSRLSGRISRGSRATGLEPQRLEIEITEGVVMDGNAAMKQVLPRCVHWASASCWMISAPASLASTTCIHSGSIN